MDIVKALEIKQARKAELENLIAAADVQAKALNDQHQYLQQAIPQHNAHVNALQVELLKVVGAIEVLEGEGEGSPVPPLPGQI